MNPARTMIPLTLPARSRFAALVVCLLALLIAAAPATGQASSSTGQAVAAGPAETLPTPAELDAYLAAKGSPMAGQGAAFVASGGRWKVDPRLLVAIAGAESAFGSITCADYNAWGWGCPNGPYSFTSWADAIETVTTGLRANYLSEGRTTVALIQQKYAPSGAANDPTGLNNHWVANVSQFLLELGGNPNDVDFDGVAGTRPLGLEFASPLGVAAADYDFAPQADAPDAADLETIAGRATPVEIALTNSGAQAWDPSLVRLRRVDVDPRITSGPIAGLEETVEPGGDAVFTIDLRAAGSSAGTVDTLWRLEGPTGAFGVEIARSIRVVVPSLVAGAAEVRAPESLQRGTTQKAVVRVQNGGADPWLRAGEAGVSLGVRTASGPPLVHAGWLTPQAPSSLLEREVEPGEWGTFAFQISMPALAQAPAKLELRVFAGSLWAEGELVVLEIQPA